MIQQAVASFVGAFAALVVLAEIQMSSKLLKYVVALLAGTLLAVVLTWVLAWMLRAIGQAS